MKWKRILSATLASGLGMWALAGLWHQLVMKAFYDSHDKGEHSGVMVILAAYLILAGLMAWLYGQSDFKAGGLAKGLLFGAVMGLLWVFPHELAMAGAHSEPFGYVFQNALWHLVEQGFGGLLLAWTWKRFP